MYEVFEHTADLGLRIRADDLDALMVEAARGLFSLIVSDLDSIRPSETAQFSVDGEQIDLLLFDWLNELLYSFESTRMLFCQFDVKVTPLGLSATALGERFVPARHQAEHEVKAITYHDLKVEKTAVDWLAEVIVDI